MNAFQYYNVPSLKNVYLEDSYVIDIREGPVAIEFILDLVLTEFHSAYEPPAAGTQYCYRAAKLIFPNLKTVHWTRRSMRPAVDADSRVDYGNIDSLEVSNGRYTMEGDWGRVEIVSDEPEIEFVLDAL